MSNQANTDNGELEYCEACEGFHTVGSLYCIAYKKQGDA